MTRRVGQAIVPGTGADGDGERAAHPGCREQAESWRRGPGRHAVISDR